MHISALLGKRILWKNPQCHLQLNNFLLFIIIMYLIMYLSWFLTLGDGSSALILGFSLWSGERVSLLGEPVTFAMTLAFFGLGLSSELETLFFRTVVCVSMDCKIQKNIIYKSHHNIKLSLWQYMYMLNNFFFMLVNAIYSRAQDYIVSIFNIVV